MGRADILWFAIDPHEKEDYPWFMLTALRWPTHTRLDFDHICTNSMITPRHLTIRLAVSKKFSSSGFSLLIVDKVFQEQFEPPPMLCTHDLQVRRLKRFGCHADLYSVSRCCTRGESEDHLVKRACKRLTLALKPRADVARSPKEGYQWPHERTYFLQKFILKVFQVQRCIQATLA